MYLILESLSFTKVQNTISPASMTRWPNVGSPSATLGLVSRACWESRADPRGGGGFGGFKSSLQKKIIALYRDFLMIW